MEQDIIEYWHFNLILTDSISKVNINRIDAKRIDL